MKKFAYHFVMFVVSILGLWVTAAILGAPPMWPDYVPVAVMLAIYGPINKAFEKHFE